jgi:hypothetical protein
MRLYNNICEGTVEIKEGDSIWRCQVKDGRPYHDRRYENGKLKYEYKQGHFRKRYNDNGKLAHIDRYRRDSLSALHGISTDYEAKWQGRCGVLSKMYKRSHVTWAKFTPHGAKKPLWNIRKDTRNLKIVFPDGTLKADFKNVSVNSINNYYSYNQQNKESFGSDEFTTYYHHTISKEDQDKMNNRKANPYFGYTHKDLKKEQHSNSDTRKWYRNGQLEYHKRVVQQESEGNADTLETWWYKDGQLKSRVENDIEVEAYTKKGKLFTKADKYENNQKQGVWLEKGKKYYYVNGVDLGKVMYQAKPEEMDATKVITEPNAQVRMALLKKIGMDLLLSKCNSELIHVQKDEHGNDMELRKIALPESGRSWNNEDDNLFMLKVHCPTTGQAYVLRVPPISKTCEDARQWTFRKGMNRQGVVEDRMKFKIEM